MKNKLGIIIGICLLAGGVIAGTLTYTTDEIQTLLDDVNDRISTSSGATDASKVIETNASGKVDATFLTSVAGVNSIEDGGTQVGGSDIVTLDFEGGEFDVTEPTDTEILIGLQDAGIDPAHLNFVTAPAAGSDEYAVTYEHSTTNFELVAVSGLGDITEVGLCATGACTADFIDETDMADSDYGDFSFSGGAATLDADVVDSAEIADNAIDSEHYTDASIDLIHMSANSVDSDQYVDGSIDTAHIAADQIDETLIADDGVDSEHYNDASIDRVHLVNDIIDGTKIEDDAVDSEHYAAGSIDNEHMAANSIDSDEYVDNSIDNAHMADDSIDSADYVDASIDPEHLNFVVVPGAGNDEYAVTYEHGTGNFELVSMSAGGTVTTLLSETVQQGGADIVSVDFDAPFTVAEAPDTYITIDLKDDGVDSQHYAAASIDLEHMSVNSIDSDQYVDDSIDLIHMSADSVDSDQYVDGSIDTAHIAADQIDGTLIADDVVDSEHYVASSIDNEHMADDSIDSAEYVDGSIDPVHLNLVVAADAGNDEYAVTYEHDTGNFELTSLAGGGTMTTVELSDSAVGDADIVTLDFDAPFGITEDPDSEINIDIVDNGLDSQHYAAGSIDTEHIAADQIDETLIADDAIDSEHYTDASIDPAHLNFAVAPDAGSDEYVVTYEHSTGNFELEVDAGGANLGLYDGGVQVGDTDIDKIDLDGTVFAVTEPVDTDILIDIADDGLDSQHYIANSVDEEHINWADITNITDDGVLVSLGGNVAVGAHEFQSTGNIVLQLGDAAGTNVFEIEDSGGVEVFQVDSDGVVNPSANPSVAGYDSDWDENSWKISDGTNEDTNDAEMLLQVKEDDTITTYIELDGINERVEVKKPLDFGRQATTISAAYDMDTSQPGVCSGFFLFSAAAEVTLPADGRCNGVAGNAKFFCFQNRTTNLEVLIDPNTGDTIYHAADAGFAVNDWIESNLKGDTICLQGSGESGWYTWNYNAAANWIDE